VALSKRRQVRARASFIAQLCLCSLVCCGAKTGLTGEPPDAAVEPPAEAGTLLDAGPDVIQTDCPQTATPALDQFLVVGRESGSVNSDSAAAQGTGTLGQTFTPSRDAWLAGIELLFRDGDARATLVLRVYNVIMLPYNTDPPEFLGQVEVSGAKLCSGASSLSETKLGSGYIDLQKQCIRLRKERRYGFILGSRGGSFDVARNFSGSSYLRGDHLLWVAGSPTEPSLMINEGADTLFKALVTN
jgi:hypothetical protein